MAVDKNMNILIVDDYNTTVLIIKNLLKQLGFHNVDEATGSADAFDMIGEKPYGLVLSSWHMEPVTGMDLLKQIRASAQKFRDVPFIMVAAQDKEESIITARHAGANEYIVTPFNAEMLQAKMMAVLGAF